MNRQVSVSKDALAAFCQKHEIKRLAVFGSALREDFGPDSDIDILVEFEADRIPGLLGIAGTELELPELFSERKVDLRMSEERMTKSAYGHRFGAAREAMSWFRRR